MSAQTKKDPVVIDSNEVRLVGRVSEPEVRELPSGDADHGTGKLHRVTMGLGALGAVAADDADAALTQIEPFHEGNREALGFVGHDAPGNCPGIEVIEVLGHALEEAGADAQCVLIDREKALLQVGIGGIGRRDAEAGANHAARA